MKNSKNVVLMSTLAGIAFSLVGCASNAPTTPTPTTPSADPGVILPPRGKPNLRIGLFDATVRADGSIKIDVEVANTGLGQARINTATRVVHVPENGRLAVVLDLPTPPIAPGRSAKLTGVINAGQIPFSKNTVLRVRADAGRQLDEGIGGGEKDNFLEKSIVYGPDLAVAGIAVAPESIKTPKNLAAVAVVNNPGNVSTGAFSAVWEYSAKSAPVGTADPKDLLPKWETLEKLQIGSIPPGKPAPEIKLSVDAAKAKTLSLNGKNVVFRLTLDPDRTINDLAKDNNASGIPHSFPPDLPDINVLGLLAWWSNQQPVIHLYPLIANTGDAVCPPFESQWFRLPGTGASAAAGNQTGGSGGDGNWQPLSPVLQHGAIQPMTWEFDPKNNTKVPEFAWTPDVRDEGETVVLKFEADLGNKVPEHTDPAADPAATTNTPPDTTTNANNTTTTAPVSKNGPNNSFVWNFQVPLLPRADLSIRSMRARLTPDKARIVTEAAFSNQGSIPTGPFKLIVSVDNRTIEVGHPGIPPTSRLFRLSAIAPVTAQMRGQGKANITFKLVGSKQEKDEKDNVRTVRVNVPRDRDPADIWVIEPSIRFLRSGRDKEFPNRIDQAQVKYTLINTGDEPTGKFSVNVAIEGGSGTRIEDEDGIPGNSASVRWSEPIDINNLALPDKYARVQATVTVDCDADENKDNNSRQTNVIYLAPRPVRPVGRPDLHVVSIGLRPTSTPQNVHLKTTIVNKGDADSPMFRVDWFINNKYQNKEGGRDWAPGLQRGASIDSFDAVWCDYKPTPADGNKLLVMVVAQPYRSIGLEKFDEDNDLDGEIDITDKGTGPQIECQHHNAPIPTTEAE